MTTEYKPPDLEPLPLQQLEALQEQVAETIQRKEQERRDTALLEIAELAQAAGLTPEMVGKHLSSKRTRGKRRRTAKLPPKYRDPANPANTWAGRGKQPRWFIDRLAAGASMADLRIDPDLNKPGKPITLSGQKPQQQVRTEG